MKLTQVLQSLFVAAFLTCSFSSYTQFDRSAALEIVQQNKRDSAHVDALFKLFAIESELDIEKAKAYLDQGARLANELQISHSQATSLTLYGQYYYLTGRNEEAMELTNQGKTVFVELEDWHGVAATYNTLGTIAYQEGDYEEALRNFQESTIYYERSVDTAGIVIAQHNMGGIHFDQGRYDKALELWGKNLSLNLAQNDTISAIYTVNAIGAVHLKRKESNRALNMMHFGLGLAKKTKDSLALSMMIMNIGTQYLDIGSLDSAEFYLIESLDLYKQLDDRNNLAILYNSLAQLSYDQGKGERSEAYADSTLQIAQELNSAPLLKVAYDGLSFAHRLLGDFEEALMWSNKKYALQDSLTGENVQMQINELQERFESEQKDREIAELKVKEAESSSIAERRRSLLIVIGTAATALVLVLIFYLGRRKAKERQRRAELEQKALRTQMNPHFIFNSLASIQQMYVSGELDLANDYMGDFGTLMRKILDNSGKDRISVKEEIHMLKLYMELERGRSSEFIEYSVEVDGRIDQLGTKVPPMVIQPFVENAIWHGILPTKKKGMICVKLELSEKERQLVCHIEDDGVGFSVSGRKRSHEPKGISITEQRLGTKVQFQDRAPGTRVTIHIPI